MERKSVCQTACWDCFRHHRGCDGTRPCNRCKAKNRASSCRDCLPEERIGINKRRRTSRKNLSAEGIPSSAAPTSKKQRIPIQFFIINPQIFMNSTPSFSQERISDDHQDESLNFEYLRESRKESFKVSECLNTETNHNNSNCITPDQLPEYSNNIPELRGSPQTATPNQCIPPFFAESLCGATQHDLSIQPWQLTQEISEELEECQQKQPNPHAIPCAFDDIGNQLVRNAYLPFVLRSPLQPFLVFRPKADFDLQVSMDRMASQSTLLAVNSAFCDITQYTEEEILGTKWPKVIPVTNKLRARVNYLLGYLLPQPPDVKASPVIDVPTYYIARDKSLIHAQTRMQFFYSETGLVSFCVIGVEKYRRTSSDDWPRPPALAICPPKDTNIPHPHMPLSSFAPASSSPSACSNLLPGNPIPSPSPPSFAY